MITDAVIRFFGTIIAFVVNLLPDAPVIAVGNGASAGYACCITYILFGISNVMTATVSIGGASTTIISGITNSPLSLLIDWTMIAFVLGCVVAVLTAFLIVRIILLFWQQVKW